MLKRMIAGGLLALTLGVGGLLSTPSTAEAQRWRQWAAPYMGGYGSWNTPYFNNNYRYNTYWGNPYYGGNFGYNNSANFGYNNNWNYNSRYNNDTWYPGYYVDQARRYFDPTYNMYYRYDPYTGQSYWEY